jgi:hypothetical protein
MVSIVLGKFTHRYYYEINGQTEWVNVLLSRPGDQYFRALWAYMAACRLRSIAAA